MPLLRDTVAIPVAKGIDVNTPARLVDAQELLEAQNVRFTAKAGARKRRGHSGQRIRGAKAIPAAWAPPDFALPLRPDTYNSDDRAFDSKWLFGYGYMGDQVFGGGQYGRVSPTTALETSPYPDSGYAFGTAQRDSEQLVWDGQRLLSRTNMELPGGQLTELNAVMPVLRAETIAKTTSAQNYPDAGDNGTIRVAAWVSGAKAYYSVLDSALGTSIVVPTQLDINAAQNLRVIPTGKHVHILVYDSNEGYLQQFTLHQDTPAVVTKTSLGQCNSGYFDCWQDTTTPGNFWVIVSRTTSCIIWSLAEDGTMISNDSPSAITNCSTVAICRNPRSGIMGIAWRDGTTIKAGAYGLGNFWFGSVQTLGTTAAQVRPLTIAPKYLSTSDDQQVFNVYWDSWDGTKSTLTLSRFTDTTGAVYSTSAFYLQLASQAFRVGDRTFIWAGRRSAYQSCWFLLDETLRPVGKCDYVTANVPLATDTFSLASVSWSGSADAKNKLVHHCVLGYRVRVPVKSPTSLGTNEPAVYTEPVIHFIKLDFLPRLRSAQAGRTTYFAGAQMWAYDGNELCEADFNLGPEDVVVAPAVTGGSLTNTGKYIYRVDLCHRNAQNEEVRSASFFTSQLVLAGQTAITLTIPTTLTRRTNSYFLVFRNEDNGVLWYLTNSRDPSSAQFLSNDQSAATVTFTDTTADATLLSLEQHPGQTTEWLDRFSAPACEVIAAGRDRLWVAGGEIAAGQVHPSRLFDPGEAPTFNGFLAVQVDRSAEPITAIAFVGDYTVCFRKTHNYIIDNSGPDNVSSGVWNTPRRSDSNGIGALSQESVVEIAGGIVFQSAAGIRQFTPGGSIVPIGEPVDSVAKALNISSTVVVGKDQEVRFYDWNGSTLVFNYQYGAWSQWDIKAAGAVVDPTTGLVVLATPTGSLWRETDGLWTDNSGVYKMRVRFAWLRAGGLLDFQQVRRIGAIGEAHGTHKVHVDVYYNEREFAEESFDWDYTASTQNADTFGTGLFGDGNFGDDTALAGIQFRDVTWPWRRRLFRRKCSVLSVAIDDNYTNGEGFTLTALALELAKKPGLARLPWRAGTYNNTGGNGSSETGN